LNEFIARLRSAAALTVVGATGVAVRTAASLRLPFCFAMIARLETPRRIFADKNPAKTRFSTKILRVRSRAVSAAAKPARNLPTLPLRKLVTEFVLRAWIDRRNGGCERS
jgi:hypothetical protein